MNDFPGRAAPQREAQETKMTEQQERLFMAVEDVLMKQGQCFDELCQAYAAAFRMDAANETHETVKSCLEQAADHLEHAGMDWYVSTK